MIADIRLAWRMFLRGRGASLLTVAMLSAATAGTLTLFSVLTAMTDMWPDVPDRHRLARIYASNPRLGIERDVIPLGSFAQWSHLRTFEIVGAFASDERGVEGAPDVSVQAVTSTFFGVFRIAPVAGRLLTPDDASDGGRVAVIGEGVAMVKFGTPQEAVGKSLKIDDEVYTIVGVMPRAFYFPTPSVRVWVPLREEFPDRRIMGIARLRQGKTWSEAAAELSAVAREIHANASSGGWTVRPIPLEEDQSLRSRNGTLVLLGPAVLVLIIACVNATNLMLARGTERRAEFSIRLALGSSRFRIIRQVLLEGFVVAVTASTAGAAMSVWGIHLFRSWVPEFAAERLAFTSSTLVAAASVAMAAPLAISIVPALVASRPRPPSTLSGSVTPGGGGRGYGVRDVFVFLEVAVASVLVVTALMIFRLFGELHAVRPSYDPSALLVAEIGSSARATDLAGTMDDVRGVAGVVAVAAIRGLLIPIDHRGAVSMSGSLDSAACSVAEVTPGFFNTVQLALTAGRPIGEDEAASDVAIASESLAARLWGGGLPPGTLRVTVSGRTREVIVIGLAADALAPTAIEFNSGQLYVALKPAPGAPLTLLARTAGPAAAAIEPLSRALATRGPGRPRVRLLADAVGFNPRGSLITRALLGMFGGLALALAAGGIFAVSRHAVLQRTREFGIRLALGATRRRLIGSTMARDLKLIGAAVAVAAIGTFIVTHHTFVELLMLSAGSPLFWIRIIVLLGGISTVACYIATRRISRLEPMDALRDQ